MVRCEDDEEEGSIEGPKSQSVFRLPICRQRSPWAMGRASTAGGRVSVDSEREREARSNGRRRDSRKGTSLMRKWIRRLAARGEWALRTLRWDLAESGWRRH